MASGIILFVRSGNPDSADAVAFLKSHKYGADRVVDLEKGPLAPTDWQLLRKAFGGHLKPVVETRSPDFLAALPAGTEGVDDDGLQAALAAHPSLLRLPILVTPKGGVAGFREQRWRTFLDIGKGNRGGV